MPNRYQWSSVLARCAKFVEEMSVNVRICRSCFLQVLVQTVSRSTKQTNLTNYGQASMSRFIGLPVKGVKKNAKGEPVAFIWRGMTYRGQVISTWRLSDRWWEREAHSDRTYYRLTAITVQCSRTPLGLVCSCAPAHAAIENAHGNVRFLRDGQLQAPAPSRGRSRRRSPTLLWKV